MHNTRYKKASSRISRRSEVRRFLSLFFKIGIPITFLVCLIFLLRADFLQVKTFEILGAEVIQVAEIENTALNFTLGNQFFLIPKSNLFFLNKEKLASVLLSKFGRLEEVSVNKHFLSKNIELKIVERKDDFFWCLIQTECFLMSKDGLVFESYSAEATRGKVIFGGILDGDPLMKNFATPEKMQNYSNLIRVFKEAGFEVSSINIESSDKAVAKIEIVDIIFNPEDENLSLTAENVVLLINELKSKNSSTTFNYIDARFNNKIFYKLY